MRLPFPFKSLRAGLLLTYVALIVISVGLLAWRIGASLDASRFSETLRDQEGRTILLAAAAEELIEHYETNQIDATTLQQEAVALANQVSQRVVIVDLQGKILVDTEHPEDLYRNEMNELEIADALQGHVARSIRYDADDGFDALFTAAPIWQGRNMIGVVRLELPMSLIQAASQGLWIRIIGASLLAVLATVIVSLWFARLLTQPMIQLTRAASAMADGNLAQRVSVKGPEELERLAGAFNFMAERISKVMGDQRAFVANAAHELRTPLTSIRLRVEALRSGAKDDATVADQFLADIESETDRLARLVDELLDLSRIETGLIAPRRAPVAVEKIARAVVTDLTARADAVGVQIAYLPPANVPGVNADPDQIRRVFINLVDNAIKYTPRGGRVQVEVGTVSGRQPHRLGAGNWVVTTVRDNGVGIPVEDLPRIFERFYRSDKARTHDGAEQSGSGAGLGLAIVKSIVEAHAGQVWAESAVGKGTAITFALPM